MQIKQLHIKKMPGFPNGLKPYEQLASNINIIAGANGTGKSSTARVLHSILWKNSKQNNQAIADIELNSEKHSVHINASGYMHTDPLQRVTADDFSSVVPASYAKHYMLALHDLIQATDSDLAEMIIDEINGGVSLKKATQQLEYSSSFASAKKQEVTDYKTAKNSYLTKLNDQKSLETESRKLQAYRTEKEQAEQAKSLNSYYHDVLKLLNEREQKKENELKCKAFSPIYEHFHIDDYSTITDWEKKLKTSSQKKIELENKKEEYSSKLKKASLQGDALSNEVFNRLDAILEELKDTKKEIASLSDEIIRHETDIQQLADSIGGQQQSDNTKTITLPELSEIETFTREANDVAFEQNRLSTAYQKIEAKVQDFKSQNNPADSMPETSTINKGIAELSKWLKEEGVKKQNSKRELYLLALASIISMGAAYFVGWFAFVGIVLVGIILLYDYLQSKKEGTGDSLMAIRETDYSKLGLEIPQQWNSEQVKSLIDSLIVLREKREKYQSIESEMLQLRVETAEANKLLSDTEKRYQELIATYHPLPDSLISANDKYNTLLYYFTKLYKWQEASTALEKEIRLKSTYEESFASLLNEANRILKSVGANAVDDATGLQFIIQQLKRDENERRENSASLNGILPSIEDNAKSIEEASAAIEGIYKRLQLPFGEKDTVYNLSEKYEEYKQATEDYKKAVLAEEIALQRLTSSNYFKEEEIDGMSIEEAQKRIDETNIEAQKYNDIVKKISDIEVKVNVGKQSQEIEIALEKREEALENLQSVLTKNLHSITGSIIAEHLKEEVSLQNDNKIFQKAQRILGNITRNRYKLLLNDDDNPSFSVIDNDMGQLHSLDELSTGTRVQLLLAVRLAYIQSIENKVKLPILVDELLANSDDQRSETIIASLIEISKERQVFYFTAQNDEVNKWKELLDKQKDISYKIYSLDKEQVEYSRPKEAIYIKPLYQDIAKPEKMSHAEYGKALRVPLFNLTEQPVASLHTWYLIPDVMQLYSCLQGGASTWGRLQNAMQQLKPERLGFDDAGALLLHKKVALLQSLKEHYSVGRPRRIDRSVLEQSKAISNKFMDAALVLLEKVEGNPLLFLERLRLKELDGFRVNKMDELQDHLIKEKYIDNKAPLDDSELNDALTIDAHRIGIDLQTANAFINLFM